MFIFQIFDNIATVVNSVDNVDLDQS